MIHFVAGTRASLLKLAPVMLECQRRELRWRWIYTAQHRQTIPETVATFGLPPAAYVSVRWSSEANSLPAMSWWLFRMLSSLTRSRRVLGGLTGRRHLVVTQGDMFSTWLGALYGKLTRTPVLHVESGLRSFDLRNPFPEEINRLITFRLTDYYACQDEKALDNVRKYKGVKLNTHGNTQIDTLRFGLANSDRVDFDLPATKFVVATVHRYENIFDRQRFARVIEIIETIAEQFDVLFIRHPSTALQLDRFGLTQRLVASPTVHLLPRLEYLPFVKAVRNCEFVVTDSGGTQAELSYLGTPTLIVRQEVEQREGLGGNAVLSRLDSDIVAEFLTNYRSYARPPQLPESSPSSLIVDLIEQEGFGAS